MPFVKVNYMEDEYDKESLTSISQTIMKALIKEFQVPKKDYFQVFSSHKKEEFFMIPIILFVMKEIIVFYISKLHVVQEEPRDRSNLYIRK